MRIVLVGTGTDVGKTHVACALLSALRERGPARGYKPIATGVPEGARCGDAELHAAAARVDYVHPTYCFVPPVSPHLAARAAGVAIDLAAIAERARALEDGGVIVVETAGGLFSPLGERATNAELVGALAPAWIVLVAPDRIGVLHDVGAALRAARAEGIAPEVVLSAPAIADPSTGTNGAELARLGIARPLATFPRAPWDAPESLEAARAALERAAGPERVGA